jgi:acetyl esterase
MISSAARCGVTLVNRRNDRVAAAARRRIWIGAPLTVGVLCQVAAQTPLPPDPSPLQRTLEGATSFVYKRTGNAALRLWVFSPAPATTEKRVAAVFFGGGGWITHNPVQLSLQARQLAASGMVAVIAEYRVRDPHGTTPFEAVSDAKSAIRWLRAHADELRLASTPLVAVGASSGGHLALAAALVEGFDDPADDVAISARPDALILFNPIPNTVANGGTPLTTVQQAAVALLGPRARDISPLHQLREGEALPPTLIFHGTLDTLVPIAEVDAFCRRAIELRNGCRVIRFEGGAHGFFDRAVSAAWYEETMALAVRFIQQLPRSSDR